MAGHDTRANRKWRSQEWFDNPNNPGITGLYLERYQNSTFTRGELQAERPIIGIAQTGSDLVPCNKIHVFLADRVKAGIRDAGGVPMEFPVHPIQETGKRPTAALDRNLQYLSLVEVLHGYPIDAVVLTTGCDKTTPAMLMGAATVDLPAIALNGGPMLDGHWKGKLAGSGTIIWESRRLLAEGKMAYKTGVRAVEMAYEDLKPSKILTRDAFLNAIATNTAIGGSTNAPPHLQAIARHMGTELNLSDWQDHGFDKPLLVNMQPAGEYLGESFQHAGGVPAVMGELSKAGMIIGSAMTVTGKTMAENLKGRESYNHDVVKTVDKPMRENAGFIVVSGNLFDSAIMKTSVISPDFQKRFLSREGSEGIMDARAIVFEGPEDYHARLNDPELEIDENCILFVRGVGCVGYPGSAEVVNMQPPDHVIKSGINHLPTVGDGRQSGTSESPSILNASPEAVVGGGLAFLETGDPVRLDLNKGTLNCVIPEEEWDARKAAWTPPEIVSQTPWQGIYRSLVGQLGDGGCLEMAVEFQRVAENLPRDNH